MPADSLKVIGGRIGAERKALGLTQNELASRIGITVARLANYEDGRGCLRCEIAFDICRNIVISEQWLATGTGDKNCYRGVVDEFPKKLLNKSFLDIYEHEIEPLYERAGYPDAFVPLLRYDDLHPDTWRIACFKLLKDAAISVKDKGSLSWYWMDVAKFAIEKSWYYSKAPRDRLNDLNKKIMLLKGGKEMPFSYEKFFDDLSLVGADWPFIEATAKELESFGNPISIERLKEQVLWDLKEFGRDSAYALYRKIYCKEK